MGFLVLVGFVRIIYQLPDLAYFLPAESKSREREREDGEGKDANEEDRERHKQASDVL